MTCRPRTLADALSVIVVALCVCASSVFAQPATDTFAGRRLEDALRILQAHGLRVVFSSELVTPDMRVRAEPRAKAAREQLAELLQPHDLAAENGPHGIIQVVRKKKRSSAEPSRSVAPAAQPKKADPNEADLSAAGTSYRERVTVVASRDERDAVSAGIDRQLSVQELNAQASMIADDPLRVVQALPGVATGDDFRGEYSVRGSDYRHAGVVIDGVVAPWLQHAALGRGDTGTLTMLRGDMIQEAALSVGAYPRVDSSQIGPQLNLTLREGSRTGRRFTIGASGMSATLTAEGPMGSSARGSWLVGVRRSHGEWPASRGDEDSTVFGFGDLQAKVVYDVRPGHQVSFSLIAGQSNVEREYADPFGLADGLNQAAMATAAWRSVIGGDTVVTQRVSLLVHDFSNRNESALQPSRGTNGAGAYRMDLRRPLFKGVIDAGAQVRRVHGSRHGLTWSPSNLDQGKTPIAIDDIESSWMERSGYASYRRAVGQVVTLSTGLRWSDSTLVQRRAVDRWLQAEWFVTPRWLIHGSTGVMHQFPALEQVVGWTDPASLRPERATYVDLGVGRRLSSSIRWDATLFARRERDSLRESDDQTLRFENALTGASHGIELTVARSGQNSLSGWIGYAYGVARYTDATRQETYAADFDQRHAINVAGSMPMPWNTRVGLTFRGGTNFPIPGYLVARNGQLFAGGERNLERLPGYARLDLRAERTFHHRGRRFTIFAETLNVLNRVNLGSTDGTFERDTGRAVGFTEQLFPRLLTAGLRLEF